MEDHKLEQLRSKNPEQIRPILCEFNTKNADLFNFDTFHTNGQWHALWRSLFTILSDETLLELHSLCLNTVRILTRDEFSLQTEDLEDDVACLLKLAHLRHIEAMEVVVEAAEEEEQQQQQGEEEEEMEGAAALPPPTAVVLAGSVTEIIAEALKCLCNLVFQSSDCRRQCVKLHVPDAILKRIASSTQYPCAVELFDMKLLFLLTAMEPSTRSRVQIDLNGIAYMTEWLDEKLAETQYGNEQLELLCEMLKVLFNITTNPDKSPNANEIQSRHLTGVIRQLLGRFGGMESERERNVVMHATNLLTNISSSCLTELMVKCDPGGPTTSQTVMFEGYDVHVLSIILCYLRAVLEEQEQAATSNELISPALTVLVKCARGDRTMRHYIRSVVLPPLYDVYQRPEVGNELRNHLCRFLTLPAMMVRDLAAELLFVCCKENVGRMIKHTGYGNAAGLFAKRGLLGGRQMENTNYSSDSEDSDTEEYKRLQSDINPVIGCYDPPKRSVLEGMSEEQKEYEAMELVHLMDKLHRSGVVQPCRIGEDGKPQPVDHILQLQEELPQQQADQKRKT